MSEIKTREDFKKFVLKKSYAMSPEELSEVAMSMSNISELLESDFAIIDPVSIQDKNNIDKQRREYIIGIAKRWLRNSLHEKISLPYNGENGKKINSKLIGIAQMMLEGSTNNKKAKSKNFEASFKDFCSIIEERLKDGKKIKEGSLIYEILMEEYKRIRGFDGKNINNKDSLILSQKEMFIYQHRDRIREILLNSNNVKTIASKKIKEEFKDFPDITENFFLEKENLDKVSNRLNYEYGTDEMFFEEIGYKEDFILQNFTRIYDEIKDKTRHEIREYFGRFDGFYGTAGEVALFYNIGIKEGLIDKDLSYLPSSEESYKDEKIVFLSKSLSEKIKYLKSSGDLPMYTRDKYASNIVKEASASMIQRLNYEDEDKIKEGFLALNYIFSQIKDFMSEEKLDHLIKEVSASIANNKKISEGMIEGLNASEFSSEEVRNGIHDFLDDTVSIKFLDKAINNENSEDIDKDIIDHILTSNEEMFLDELLKFVDHSSAKAAIAEAKTTILTYLKEDLKRDIEKDRSIISISSDNGLKKVKLNEEKIFDLINKRTLSFNIREKNKNRIVGKNIFKIRKENGKTKVSIKIGGGNDFDTAYCSPYQRKFFVGNTTRDAKLSFHEDALEVYTHKATVINEIFKITGFFDSDVMETVSVNDFVRNVVETIPSLGGVLMELKRPKVDMNTGRSLFEKLYERIMRIKSDDEKLDYQMIVSVEEDKLSPSDINGDFVPTMVSMFQQQDNILKIRRALTDDNFETADSAGFESFLAEIIDPDVEKIFNSGEGGYISEKLLRESGDLKLINLNKDIDGNKREFNRTIAYLKDMETLIIGSKMGSISRPALENVVSMLTGFHLHYSSDLKNKVPNYSTTDIYKTIRKYTTIFNLEGDSLKLVKKIVEKTINNLQSNFEEKGEGYGSNYEEILKEASKAVEEFKVSNNEDIDRIVNKDRVMSFDFEINNGDDDPIIIYNEDYCASSNAKLFDSNYEIITRKEYHAQIGNKNDIEDKIRTFLRKKIEKSSKECAKSSRNIL